MVLKDAELVIERVIAAALAGDMRAAQLILDRALPRRVCRPAPAVAMPPLRTVKDAVAAMGAIASAAMTGEITTTEAAELSTIIENFTRVIDVRDLETRLRAIEHALGTAANET